MHDDEIARVLNLNHMTTPGGLRWTRDRVEDYRKMHRVRSMTRAVDPEVMTMNQAQEYLSISHNGLLALVRRGVITKGQIIDFAPWRVSKKELDADSVQDLVKVLTERGRLPEGGSPERQLQLFDVDPASQGEVKEGAL